MNNFHLLRPIILKIAYGMCYVTSDKIQNFNLSSLVTVVKVKLFRLNLMVNT